jgi:hypothetical protein
MGIDLQGIKVKSWETGKVEIPALEIIFESVTKCTKMTKLKAEGPEYSVNGRTNYC